MTLRIGSLFSGAGGLDIAVLQVFGGRVAWHAELEWLEDKDGKFRPNAAIKVLEHHWPGVPNLGDISAIDWSTVDPIDILCGGFPCQDVSVAGLRVGIAEGTRSGLWAMFAKAIAALRPKFVVIENVRGLHSAEAHRGVESADATVGDGSDGSVLRATGAVLGDLAELGYDAQWVTVSAASVGAPHERFRVFILATDASSERRTDIARFCSAGRQSIVTEPGAGDRDRGRDCSAGVRQFRRTAGELAPVDLLPTPSVADATGGHATRSGTRSNELLLPGVARAYGNGDLLPTPTARDGKGSNPNRDGGPDLPGALLPTPQANLGEHRRDNGQDPAKRRAAGKQVSLADELCYLPTPAAADADRGPDFARAGRKGSGGDDLVTLCARATRGIGTRWGKYEPAISRWEQVTRPAPSPTEPNTKGNPRLAPVFPEWMMGWPDGWVTAVPGVSRNDQLRIIGNGVCPQQAASALRQLVRFVAFEVAA